jgi:putative hydrolase of the HAD superfamily
MLDMGGVLTQDQRLDKVDEMMRLLGVGCAREDFHAAYFEARGEYDRGAYGGEEYWRRVAEALGARPVDGALGRIVQTDLESWFNMRPAMLEFLGGVRGRVGRRVLLSNIHADGARFIREGEARSWAGLFDTLILSCEHKLLKPEREIYELALDAAGALPSETLFVDDNAVNVEGARAAGLSSFRFAGEEDFFETLAREYELAL